MLRHQQVVEHAEAYFSVHMNDRIPLNSLCDILGVSERTLRNAFYRVRGMSPKRYLLRTRLRAAHEALRRGGQQRTVAEVATRCGFFELGRFAQRYKAAFGEYPSATLKAAMASLAQAPAPRSTSHKLATAPLG